MRLCGAVQVQMIEYNDSVGTQDRQRSWMDLNQTGCNIGGLVLVADVSHKFLSLELSTSCREAAATVTSLIFS